MNKNKKFISTFIILLIVGLIVVILPFLNKENNVVQTFKNFDPIKIITNKSEAKVKDEDKNVRSKDIIGKISIPGTNIDSDLMQTTDNEYYLNHSISNEYDEKGSIFIDYRTDLNSKQINIYGHNSNVYDVIFKELENYLDKNYFSNHKYIELWDGDKTKIYEIFSVQVVTSGYEHYTVNPSNLEAHIMNLNNSIYETGNVASTKDEILVIQTCLYNPANSLLLINAKKV